MTYIAHLHDLMLDSTLKCMCMVHIEPKVDTLIHSSTQWAPVAYNPMGIKDTNVPPLVTIYV